MQDGRAARKGEHAVVDSAMQALAQQILAGQRRALAKGITLVESTKAVHRLDAATLLSHVMPATGGALRIGISGAPGVGKSTFIEALGRYLTSLGHKVAVLAVDPTSAVTGGSILGDKTRMPDLSVNPNAFVRPSPAGRTLGGVTRRTRESMLLCEAAGFDVVLIETVGVGQDEVDIAGAAETVLVISAPGLGDGIQAIKAGVLEIADIHVVSKCDKDESSRTVADLKSMLHLCSTARNHHGWEVPVLRTSAETNLGIDDLNDALDRHRIHLVESGERIIRRRQILETRIVKTAEDLMRQRITQGVSLSNAVESALAGDKSPRQAAEELLKTL